MTVLAALSCQKEAEYQPGEPEVSDSYGVYIPVQEATGSHTYDPSMERVASFTVSREKSNGAITVPYTVTASEDGVFQFGEIVFADGQTETTLDVTFENAPEGKEVSFTLELLNEGGDKPYYSIYGSGATAFSFSVMIVRYEYILNPKTGEPAVFEFSQDWWGETAWAYVKYYEVNGVWNCQTETILHEYEGDYYEDPSFFGAGEGELEFVIYTNSLNADGYPYMEMKPICVYYHTSYEAYVWGFDYYYYWTLYNPQDVLAGYSWIEFAAEYAKTYPLSYYDNNGGLYFYVKGYYMYGIGGWEQAYYEVVGIAEGFTRVDYSLTLEGDYTQDGVTPVYVEAGADVASIQYAVYPGSLTASAVSSSAEAIIAGTDASETYSDFEFDEEDAVNYGAFGIAPETSGAYTVVAVGYDAENNPQEYASVVVNHIAASDTEDHLVDISVFTEATPSRYTGYTEYDSFAYGVSGKNIVEAHIGIYPSNKLNGAALDNLKFGDDAAVPADVLAAINGDGGYYTVAGGLAPGTEYTVVVWATNGSLDAFAAATFETTPSPEVWETVGTATWTDSFFSVWFGADPVSYEVELQESQDTPGRYRLVNVYGEAFPYNEPGDWDDSKDYYLVINADDPDYVWMEYFDSGCDWGYGDFLLVSDAGYYVYAGNPIELVKSRAEDLGILFGTMEGGTVTFPAGCMLKAMAGYNGAVWYYGNQDEDYTITFNFDEAAVTAKAAKATAKKQFTGSAVKASPEAMPAVSFEREAKPVEVKTVRMDVVRKEKASGKKALTEPARPVSFQTIR